MFIHYIDCQWYSQTPLYEHPLNTDTLYWGQWTPKQALQNNFSDYFNTWQASVTTRKAIGCGIY